MDATPIFIFDNNENLQTILRVEGDSLPYYSANYKDQLFNADTTVHSQAENSLSFSIPANDPNSSYVVDGALAAFKDLDGKFKMFEIRILDDNHNAELYKEAYGVNIGQTELNDEFIENLVMTDVDNNTALADVLTGTDWQVGTVAVLGNNSLNLQRFNVLNALAQLVQTWGGEIVFRVEITDNNITGRYIDWLDRTGTNTGKRFEYGKDINSIQKTTDTSKLKTALYGYGQADSNGNRLTFGDIVWSVANGDPVDKPQGQTWVGDPNGLVAWGRKNGAKHRFGEYDASNITDATELLNATWANVQNVETPLISYQMSVITLEQITGLSHEAIRNGDTVKAIDSEFSPALRLEARILEYDRDLINPYNSSVVLGNFLPTLATNQSQLKTLQRTINDNAGKWDTAVSEANNPTITDSNFKDTTPTVPGNLTADGGFKTIMLNWDYDTSAYIAAYEVYASQTSGFTPDSTTLIWRGKAGSYVLEANTNQQWYFQVRALNTHGTAGSFTSQISAQTVQVQNIDIAIGTVNSQTLADSSVIAAKLASGSVSAAALQKGSVGTSALADVGVTTGKMADLAVVAGKLANGAVGNTQLASQAVDTGTIANAAITSALIADGTIKTADIGNAQITSALIASAAIGTAAIQNLAVTNSKIANATIGTAQIANAAITSALIRSAAVGTAAIANAAITNAKIASAAIGSAQLQDAIITNAKIANLAVDNAKIASGTITADKMSVTQLSAITANLGSVTAGNIAIDTDLIQASSTAIIRIGKTTDQQWIELNDGQLKTFIIDPDNSSRITNVGGLGFSQHVSDYWTLTGADIALNTSLGNIDIASQRDGAINLTSGAYAGGAGTEDINLTSAQDVNIKASRNINFKSPAIGMALTSTGYQTSEAGTSTVGYWTKIAEVDITAQYEDADAVIDFYGYGTTTNSVSGRIILRVKQQNPLGTLPSVFTKLIQMDNIQNSSLKAVVTINSASQTVVQYWLQNTYAYQIIAFNPILSHGVTYFSNTGLLSAAPGGVASYNATSDFDMSSGNIVNANEIIPSGTGAAYLDGNFNMRAKDTSISTNSWNVLNYQGGQLFQVNFGKGGDNQVISHGDFTALTKVSTPAIYPTSASSNMNVFAGTSSGNIKLRTQGAVYIRDIYDDAYRSINASQFAVNSVERAKTNISPMKSALETVNSSVVYQYNLKDDIKNKINKLRYGYVIGRETPEQVIDGEAVDIYSMSALNARAIQEISNRIDDMNKRLTAAGF